MIVQTMWSRATQSRCSCRCISCLNSPASALTARRTATAPIRRRFNAGDAFGLFLVPVLGSAAVFDAQAKEDRKKEWDKKIAEVREDVQKMRDNEARVLQEYSLKKRRRKFPTLGQIRGYSTAAAGALRAVEDDIAHEMDRRFANQPETSAQNIDKGAADGPGSDDSLFIGDVLNLHDLRNGGTDITEIIVEHNTPLLRRKRQLLTRQLALKFLLRPYFHAYAPHNKNYSGKISDCLALQDNTALFEELRQTRSEITRLRHASQEVAPSPDPISDSEIAEAREERAALNAQLFDLIRLYRGGSISMFDFLRRSSRIFLASSHPISGRTFHLLITHFCHDRQEDLGNAVIDTLFESKMKLTDRTICMILTHYIKTMNIKGFDRILKHMHGKNKGHADAERWRWYPLQGTQVLVPPNPSTATATLNVLIYGALKFGRLQDAMLWEQVKLHEGCGEAFRDIGCFLRYYTTQWDRTGGLKWLARALNYPLPADDMHGGDLERFVLTILTFCRACEKHSLYKSILTATIHSQLDWSRSHNVRSKLVEPCNTIVGEWRAAQAEYMLHDPPIVFEEEKARMLGSKLSLLAKNLGLSNNVDSGLHQGHAAGALRQSRIDKAEARVSDVEIQTRLLVSEVHRELDQMTISALRAALNSLSSVNPELSDESRDTGQLQELIRLQRQEMTFPKASMDRMTHASSPEIGGFEWKKMRLIDAKSGFKSPARTTFEQQQPDLFRTLQLGLSREMHIGKNDSEFPGKTLRNQDLQRETSSQIPMAGLPKPPLESRSPDPTMDMEEKILNLKNRLSVSSSRPPSEPQVSDTSVEIDRKLLTLKQMLSSSSGKRQQDDHHTGAYGHASSLAPKLAGRTRLVILGARVSNLEYRYHSLTHEIDKITNEHRRRYNTYRKWRIDSACRIFWSLQLRYTDFCKEFNKDFNEIRLTLGLNSVKIVAIRFQMYNQARQNRKIRKSGAASAVPRVPAARHIQHEHAEHGLWSVLADVSVPVRELSSSQEGAYD